MADTAAASIDAQIAEIAAPPMADETKQESSPEMLRLPLPLPIPLPLPPSATTTDAPAPTFIPASNVAPALVLEPEVVSVVKTKGVKSAIMEQFVADQFESSNTGGSTVFGNKSLSELQSIQNKASHLSAGISFSDPSLRIPQPILEALTIDMRFEKPSEIQACTIPLILFGKSVIAQAQSGAGKTVAFVTGMLAKIDQSVQAPQALCLTPTRELAIQILSLAVKPLAGRMPNITYEDALPGRDIPEGEVCRSHIVVGTPGTVKRWINNRYLSLARVRIFVLDEADKMVEDDAGGKGMGKDTLDIKKQLKSEQCQVLFFSATYSESILSYARRIVPQALVVKPKSTEELVLDVIFQVRMDVTRCPGGKLQVLEDIYCFLTIQQSIVFVERRKEADTIAAMMNAQGFDVSTLHGELSPADRDRVMQTFRDGQSKVLITTNALARGVDVPAVAVVVNFDLPVKRVKGKMVADEETYLHRIGRCGRFGRRGTAINFLEKAEDFQILEYIERFYSPAGPMTTEWDATDIEGLSDAIKDRPEGGEVLPAAETTSGGAGSTITVTQL